MSDLISKDKLLKDLRGVHDMLIGAGDPFLAGVLTHAIRCVEEQPVITCCNRRSGDVHKDCCHPGACTACD